MADADPTASMAAVQPHVQGAIEELRALIEKADPLPWREREGHYREIQASPWAAGEYGPMVTTLTGQIAAQQGRGKHNVALIVAAVNAFPELLDHLASCHRGRPALVGYVDGLLAASIMVRALVDDHHGSLLIDVDEGTEADTATLAFVADMIERRAKRVAQRTH